MSRARKTTEPAKPGETSNVLPEFGRAGDVQRLFGIKRGTLYNLMNDSKIKGVVLRVRGQTSGVRLFHLKSVRDFIYSQMSQGDVHQPAASEKVA